MILVCRVILSSLLYQTSAINWFGSSVVYTRSTSSFPSRASIKFSRRFISSASSPASCGSSGAQLTSLVSTSQSEDVDAKSVIAFITLLRSSGGQASCTNVSLTKHQAGARYLLTSTPRWLDSSFHSAKSIEQTFMTCSKSASMSSPMRTLTYPRCWNMNLTGAERALESRMKGPTHFSKCTMRTYTRPEGP